jgi:hypothetical protein
MTERLAKALQEQRPLKSKRVLCQEDGASGAGHCWRSCPTSGTEIGLPTEARRAKVGGSTGLVTVAKFMRNDIAAHAKQLATGWLG